MQSSLLFEFGAECLGAVGVTAAWRRWKTRNQYPPMVVIQASSTVDEGVFKPAMEVTVCGRDALLTLRTVIDEALKGASE